MKLDEATCGERAQEADAEEMRNRWFCELLVMFLSLGPYLLRAFWGLFLYFFLGFLSKSKRRCRVCGGGLEYGGWFWLNLFEGFVKCVFPLGFVEGFGFAFVEVSF